MKIAVIADEDTVNCFKLAGLDHAYSVKSASEADERIREFSSESKFAIIVTTDTIANRIKSTINEITEKTKFPIIISIQKLGEKPQALFDPITEIIKRKTGIELKL
jgi:V/A-type H+-transporting ATPase subunit F